jgi:hypothetical protein
MRHIHQATLIATLALSATAFSASPIARVQGLLGFSAVEDYEFDSGEYAADNEFAPFSSADEDLGVQEILRPVPARAEIRFNFINEFLWTNNAPSAAPATDGTSTLWIGRAALNWRPRIVGPVFADLAVSQEMLRFHNSTAIDFENLEARAGVFASLPDLDDTIVFARYEYQRLTSGSLSDGDYNAHRLRIGARKVLWANARQELSAGLDAAFDLGAKPGLLERDEYAGDLAYRYFITPKLSAAAYCRVSYFDYDAFGRADWAFNPGVELNWKICPGGRVFTSLYFSENDSNTPFGVNDYESWTTGLGIGMNLSF